MQKRLSNLQFFYTIPFSHLSFAVQNTSCKFVFNASYNQFVTHDAQTYQEFISKHSIPLPTPQISQPGAQSRVPSTPVNYVANSVDPLQSIRAQPSGHSHMSRLAVSNIHLLRTSISDALGDSTAQNNLSVNPATLINRLLNHGTWTNRDLGLLILSINGVNQIELPTVFPDPQDQISDSQSQEEETSEHE